MSGTVESVYFLVIKLLTRRPGVLQYLWRRVLAHSEPCGSAKRLRLHLLPRCIPIHTMSYILANLGVVARAADHRAVHVCEYIVS